MRTKTIIASIILVLFIALKIEPKFSVISLNIQKVPSQRIVSDSNHQKKVLGISKSKVRQQTISDIRKQAETRKEKWGKLLANHPYNNRPQISNKEWKKIPKADRPDLAMEQDYLMTMDPALLAVPTERKLLANKEVESLLKNKSAISGITWQERGPNNVGGRTRALMFDPNDPTYKKVWAGGVAGGLWFTNDITATPPVWNHVNDFWDNLIVSSIAYNPANTQEFYVGTGEGWYNSDAQRGGGIWKTSDGGVNWTNLAATSPGAYNSSSHFQYVNKIVIKNDGTIFAATRGYYINTGGIMRSTDGGVNWSRVLTVYTVSTTLYDRGADIEIAANGDLYASMGIFSTGQVFKSLNANNGATGTWTNLSTNIGVASAKRIELACAPSNSNVIYAVAHGGAGDTDVEWFKKSTDGGTTWSVLTIPLMVDGLGDHFTRGQAFYDLILAVHPTNPDLVIVGGIDLHRTTDGGTNWTGISHWYGGFSKPEVHADQHAIIFRPLSSNEALFGNDGGIYYSADAGNSAATPSFASKNTGYNVTQFYSCAAKNEVNSNYFLAGAQDNGSHKFTLPQVAATTEVSGGDGAFCHIDQANPNIQITSYTNNNLYRSLDGGNSFPSLISQTSGHFINPSDYDSQRKILYLAANDNQVKRISGIDGTINNVDLSIAVGTAQVSALKVSTFNDVLFLGIENGRVYKYSNASSATPTLVRIDNGTLPITTSGWVSCIDLGANDNHIMVTFSNYGVTSIWETTDGGTNWYSKEGNLPDMPVRWALYNPENRNQVLLATEVGVWSTDNFGTGTNSAPVWGVSSTNLAYTRCTMLKYRPADKMVVVSTHGRGLFTSDIFSTTTVADFVVDSPISCSGSLTVNFTDGSLKPNNSWAWDIDNNGTTDYTSQNPSHTYSSPGLYSAKLTIDNGAVSTTKENMILVLNSEPTSNIGCTLTSNSNNGNGYGIGISRFAIGNIDNSTINNDGYYSNYTCSKSTQLELNKTYNISVTTGTYNDEGARVYIDYNDNGIFESGESVVSFPSNTSGARTLTFTTPSTGVILEKGLRLRVLSKFGGIPSTACDVSTYGQAEDYTVYFINDATWNGISGTDWFTTTNWSYSSVPGTGINAKIPSGCTNYPVLTNNVTCRDLKIESGASVTINPLKSLTVTGNLSNNNDVNGLIVKSDASGTGSLIHSTANIYGTFERYMNNADCTNWKDGWHFLSSPIISQAISPAFTTDPYDFYCWYEPSNNWINFKNTTVSPTWNTANGSNNFTTGRGYMAAYDESGIKLFTGALTVSDVPIQDLAITNGGANKSWHLLGNPFASALTWDASSAWNMTNIAGVAKIWNEATQSYTDLTSSPSTLIPATNGLMVQVANGSGNLTLPASKRVHSSQAFYKSTEKKIKLIAHNMDLGNAQESNVAITPEATEGFDLMYDGEFLVGYGPQFYSQTGNVKLSTNSIPVVPFETGIPFAFVPNEGNNFQIEATGLETIDSPAWLLDKKTNIDYKLSENSAYNFTASPTDNPNRFLLHFSGVGQKELFDKDQLKAWFYDQKLYVVSLSEKTQLEVIDLQGRILFTEKLYGKATHSIAFDYPPGCYLVRISDNKQSKAIKIVVY
ncbi:MAG: GEVED domain-containing protein [Bacteroidales bacterium]